MTRVGALVGVLLAGCATREPSIADAGHDAAVVAREPTWRSTIEPMFARHCTGCHSDGALAPVDLRSMETVRSLGRLIASLLRERVMPPLAPRAGLASIDDHRALPEAEIAQFERWIALGGPEGAESAAASAFARPSNRDPLPAVADLIVTPATAWTAPADRDESHRCFVTPQTLERDRRLVGVRISPSDAATVHRVVLYAVHGEDATRVQALDPSQRGFECFSRLRAAQEEWSSRPLPVLSTQQVVGWTPGDVGRFFPRGTAIDLLAGTRFVLQVHYRRHRVSEPRADQTRAELFFRDDPTLARAGWFPSSVGALSIPAGAPRGDTRARASARWTGPPIVVHGAHALMHLRGRSIALSRASQPLFALDRWDFYWTRDEFFSSALAPVTELELSCEWDNSPAGQPVINGELASPRDLAAGDTPEHERCEILLFAAESRT